MKRFGRIGTLVLTGGVVLGGLTLARSARDVRVPERFRGPGMIRHGAVLGGGQHHGEAPGGPSDPGDRPGP